MLRVKGSTYLSVFLFLLFFCCFSFAETKSSVKMKLKVNKEKSHIFFNDVDMRNYRVLIFQYRSCIRNIVIGAYIKKVMLFAFICPVFTILLTLKPCKWLYWGGRWRQLKFRLLQWEYLLSTSFSGREKDWGLCAGLEIN